MAKSVKEDAIIMVSLDTSTTRTGWAVFVNGCFSESGVINHEKEKNPLIRQENMIIDIKRGVLDKYYPEIVVIERPPFINSPKILIDLTEIVGTVRGWAIDKAEYVEYGVTEWRKLVADDGEKIPTKRGLAKDWDMMKFKKYTGKNAIDDNEADAVLIGLARLNETENVI